MDMSILRYAKRSRYTRIDCSAESGANVGVRSYLGGEVKLELWPTMKADLESLRRLSSDI